MAPNVNPVLFQMSSWLVWGTPAPYGKKPLIQDTYFCHQCNEKFRMELKKCPLICLGLGHTVQKSAQIHHTYSRMYMYMYMYMYIYLYLYMYMYMFILSTSMNCTCPHWFWHELAPKNGTLMKCGFRFCCRWWLIVLSSSKLGYSWIITIIVPRYNYLHLLYI